MRRKGFRSLFATTAPLATARAGFAAARVWLSATRVSFSRTVHGVTAHQVIGRQVTARQVTARRRISRGLSIIIALMTMISVGCSALQSSNRTVIKVASKRNTARANRLTYAGIRAMAHERSEVAGEKFRDAIDADFSYGPAHNNLGLLHYEQGNLYQAILAFEQAREFLPADPAVVNNLALALEAAGQTQEALELYYTANAMDRANPHYLGNLVRLRVRLGEHDDILQQQLRDLAMIETRPDWRRWADHQLALNLNDALDRGPATPDFESTANESRERKQTDLRDKIIDLTPVIPASLEEEIPPGIPSTSTSNSSDQDANGEPSPQDDDSNRDLEQLLKQDAEDLSEDDYYRQ